MQDYFKVSGENEFIISWKWGTNTVKLTHSVAALGGQCHPAGTRPDVTAFRPLSKPGLVGSKLTLHQVHTQTPTQSLPAVTDTTSSKKLPEFFLSLFPFPVPSPNLAELFFLGVWLCSHVDEKRRIWICSNSQLNLLFLQLVDLLMAFSETCWKVFYSQDICTAGEAEDFCSI